VGQDVFGPTELLCPLQIELALGRVLALLQDHQILRPAYFSHQWCDFFFLGVSFVELFDSPEVSGGEAANAGELCAEIFGETLDHGPPPSLPLLAFAD
jgi:hypothetical protein